MKNLIENFSAQLKEALEIGNAAELKEYDRSFNNVLIMGLGGSSIGGTIASGLLSGDCSVPITVNKDYFIPRFVNEKTLVIASSYSGNTEETLNAFRQAFEKKAEICCVTSGGKLMESAKNNHLNYIQLPGGMPPRAALAYSFTQIFFVLHHYGLMSEGFKKQIQQAAELLDQEEENIRKQAKNITERLYGKTPVIYAAAPFEGVAVRFRQQINENSKMLCWHHVIPEMNHNELVGWRTENENLAVVLFRNDSDYTRNQKRMEISKEVISNYTSTIIEVHSKGSTDLIRSLYLVHLGDWVSFYLGEKNGMDVTEVKVIDYLKSELAK